jgi:hypothetical protein
MPRPLRRVLSQVQARRRLIGLEREFCARRASQRGGAAEVERLDEAAEEACAVGRAAGRSEAEEPEGAASAQPPRGAAAFGGGSVDQR